MRGIVIDKDVLFIKEKARDILKLEVLDIKRLGGLTNHTYLVNASDNKDYIFRIPGEGTESLINRNDEKISTKLACTLNIDAELLYFQDNGFKITKCIEEPITMSPLSMKEELNLKEAALIFRRLHNSKVDTGVIFDVFDMAKVYEDNINKYNVELYSDYYDIKDKIHSIKHEIDTTCNINVAPCHNDPLCENWVRGKDRLYLIDWEYAGMNDALWDLADVSIEAEYDSRLDELFLETYYGFKPTKEIYKHFLANKIYVDFLWTLWALTRVPFDGLPMEAWALERYERLKKNIANYYNI